jgi:hypothetical protein
MLPQALAGSSEPDKILAAKSLVMPALDGLALSTEKLHAEAGVAG